MEDEFSPSRNAFVDDLRRILGETRSDAVFRSSIWSDRAGLLSTALCLAPISRAQVFQDAWVLYETKFKRAGFFVEFGASDGITLSNTYLLEKEFGWTGILAEPNPETSRYLLNNRSCFVSNKCVSGRSGEFVNFILADDPHLSTIEKYLDADLHSDARRGGKSIDVKTISLLELLKEADAPHEIDYLSIDTEGSEFDILEAFDFNDYNIKLITVEHNYAQGRTKLNDLLVGKGYVRKFDWFSQFDDWYFRLQ